MKLFFKKKQFKLHNELVCVTLHNVAPFPQRSLLQSVGSIGQSTKKGPLNSWNIFAFFLFLLLYFFARGGGGVVWNGHILLIYSFAYIVDFISFMYKRHQSRAEQSRAERLCHMIIYSYIGSVYRHTPFD